MRNLLESLHLGLRFLSWQAASRLIPRQCLHKLRRFNLALLWRHFQSVEVLRVRCHLSLFLWGLELIHSLTLSHCLEWGFRLGTSQWILLRLMFHIMWELLLHRACAVLSLSSRCALLISSHHSVAPLLWVLLLLRNLLLCLLLCWGLIH